MKKIQEKKLIIGWAIACIATLGSVAASEIFAMTPCILCWYQRICMSAAAFFLTLTLVLNSKNLTLLSLSFCITGALIAGYHILIQDPFFYPVLHTEIFPSRIELLVQLLSMRLLSFYSFLCISTCIGLSMKARQGP